MKKIILLLLIFFSCNPLYALVEEFEKPILLEPEENIQQEKISPYTKKALRGIIEKEYDLKSTEGMFKEQLHAEFKRGIIKDTQAHIHFIQSFNQTIDSDDNDFKYDINRIRFGLDGQFKSKKEVYNLLFDLVPSAFDDYSHRFLLDAYIQTSRLKNHQILFGYSRPKIGYETNLSSKLSPFLLRNQLSRNLADVRKGGLRIMGDYKYVDYEIGGYSSDTYFHEFFPGVEGNIWLGFKPLANFDDKYGNLYIGGGLSAGERNNQEFSVATSALVYEYKKFSFQSEYGYADGSNGRSGLTARKAQGYNFTLGYMLTKKLQFLLRYDNFDSDRKIKHNNTKEYSAGLNYFILGQTARILLNYIYCDNQAKSNSHRIILGTQFIL